MSEAIFNLPFPLTRGHAARPPARPAAAAPPLPFGGEAHDNRLAGRLLSRLKSGTMLLADRGYDADWIRALVRQHGAWANIHQKEVGQRRYASFRIFTGL